MPVICYQARLVISRMQNNQTGAGQPALFYHLLYHTIMNTFLNIQMEFVDINDRAAVTNQLIIIKRMPLLKRINNRGYAEQRKIAMNDYDHRQRKRATRASKAEWKNWYR